MDITVTAHNCLPYQGVMEVRSRIGDANDDGTIDVGDVLFLINYLFIDGPEPDPWENGDVNCNGEIDIEDVLYLINYLFKGGSPPCP
jgi:hypothetical protein